MKQKNRACQLFNDPGTEVLQEKSLLFLHKEIRQCSDLFSWKSIFSSVMSCGWEWFEILSQLMCDHKRV